jgi:hypothetical protein
MIRYNLYPNLLLKVIKCIILKDLRVKYLHGNQSETKAVVGVQKGLGDSEPCAFGDPHTFASNGVAINKF